MQLSLPSCHFIPLRSKYLLSTLFSNTFTQYFFNVRDKDSHLYKTTGKLVVLYILIFTFSDNTREGKTF
jgi:hypothetical protein